MHPSVCDCNVQVGVGLVVKHFRQCDDVTASNGFPNINFSQHLVEQRHRSRRAFSGAFFPLAFLLQRPLVQNFDRKDGWGARAGPACRRQKCPDNLGERTTADYIRKLIPIHFPRRTVLPERDDRLCVGHHVRRVPLVVHRTIHNASQSRCVQMAKARSRTVESALSLHIVKRRSNPVSRCSTRGLPDPKSWLQFLQEVFAARANTFTCCSYPNHSLVVAPSLCSARTPVTRALTLVERTHTHNSRSVQ